MKAGAALLRMAAGGDQNLVPEEGVVVDCLGDAGGVLVDDEARADVEVADLGVAHLTLGQADR